MLRYREDYTDGFSYVWCCSSVVLEDSQSQLTSFGRQVVDLRDDLLSSGGIFFGHGYDPMDSLHAELTGALFSTAQVMGIPSTFLCEDMDWAQDYAGYAAMLGIRRELACFGAHIYGHSGIATRGQVSQRVDGLRALCNATFKVFASFTLVDELFLSASLEDITSLADSITLLVLDLGPGFEGSVEPQVLSHYLDSVCGILSGRGVGLLLSPAFTRKLSDLSPWGSWVISWNALPSLFFSCDTSVVVAGDIDSVVEDVCREVNEENIRRHADELQLDARRAVEQKCVEEDVGCIEVSSEGSLS